MNSTPQHPDLFTGPEAAQYLRLVDSAESPEAGLRALYRLVRRGQIHPLAWTKAYLFHRRDLDTFVAAEIEALQGASDTVSEGEPRSDGDNAEIEASVHKPVHK